MRDPPPAAPPDRGPLGGVVIEDDYDGEFRYEHGLALLGLDSFRASGAGLVIGYGRPAEHAYTTALARLCAVLDR
jgi:hypothetical protein